MKIRVFLFFKRVQNVFDTFESTLPQHLDGYIQWQKKEKSKFFFSYLS